MIDTPEKDRLPMLVDEPEGEYVCHVQQVSDYFEGLFHYKKVVFEVEGLGLRGYIFKRPYVFHRRQLHQAMDLHYQEFVDAGDHMRVQLQDASVTLPVSGRRVTVKRITFKPYKAP